MPDTFSTPTSTSTSTSSSSTIDLTCAMHDLNPDEQCTCESIVRAAPGSTICPMPTHHIDPHGWLSGFTFSCPGASPISALPLSRHTFFGHTACECTASSADIIRLLSDVEGARRTMQSLLLSVRERCKSSPVATFACRPENAEGYLRGGHVAGIRTKRTVDSQEWVPEVNPAGPLSLSLLRPSSAWASDPHPPPLFKKQVPDLLALFVCTHPSTSLTPCSKIRSPTCWASTTPSCAGTTATPACTSSSSSCPGAAARPRTSSTTAS